MARQYALRQKRFCVLLHLYGDVVLRADKHVRVAGNLKVYTKCGTGHDDGES